MRPLTALSTARPSEEQVPAASRELLGRLGKAHWATGFVTLPEIVRMAVADIGVVPLERNQMRVAERLDIAEDVLDPSLAWQSL